MNVFDLIHDLQMLRAKSALVPLDANESASLDQLTRLVCGDEDEEEPTLVRLLRPVPAQLVLSGRGFVDTHLRLVSGDGFTVSSKEELRPGDEVIVHIEDSGRGLTYTFPCVVMGPSPLGWIVTFQGLPARVRDGNAAA